MMMKLDMSKAYDRMNWDFLRKMLLAFGFGGDWVDWVMNLVSTTFFSILVNGSPSKTFNVSRGLHQGDLIISLHVHHFGRRPGFVAWPELKGKGTSKESPSIRGEEALSHL
jgi:hypothetical protein